MWIIYKLQLCNSFLFGKMCMLENDLENHLGEFHIKMKGENETICAFFPPLSILFLNYCFPWLTRASTNITQLWRKSSHSTTHWWWEAGVIKKKVLIELFFHELLTSRLISTFGMQHLWTHIFGKNNMVTLNNFPVIVELQLLCKIEKWTNAQIINLLFCLFCNNIKIHKEEPIGHYSWKMYDFFSSCSTITDETLMKTRNY